MSRLGKSLTTSCRNGQRGPRVAESVRCGACCTCSERDVTDATSSFSLPESGTVLLGRGLRNVVPCDGVIGLQVRLPGAGWRKWTRPTEWSEV
jgi:hypothetical protein